jgi:hypothetical protein
MDRPPEIGQFEIGVQSHKDVLRLEIAVDDVLRVAVADSVGNLTDALRCVAAIKLFGISEDRKQFTARCIFHDKVYIRVVVEISIETDDVRVPQVGLDLDFATNLAFHVVFLDSSLVYDLKSHNKLGTNLPGEIDTAVLAVPERTANFEIAKEPVFGRTTDGVLSDNRIAIRRRFILSQNAHHFLLTYSPSVKRFSQQSAVSDTDLQINYLRIHDC